MSDIQKISVALTGEQLAILKAAVEAGEYATTSEIIREAIRDWQFKREIRQEDVRRLQQLWTKAKPAAKQNRSTSSARSAERRPGLRGPRAAKLAQSDAGRHIARCGE
jgi:antitoxin ParD1/3/4